MSTGGSAIWNKRFVPSKRRSGGSVDSDETSRQVVPTLTSVPELRQILSVLLDHLEAQGAEIELSHDFYWFLDPSARRDLERDPSDPTVGQLSENLASLRSMIGSRDVLAYGLVWAAEILRTVGEDRVG
jgi:hypothetical protein